MLPVPDAVAAKLPHLPDGPGVYLWKGRDGTTLYVGKAKRLRSRVRSYFANDQLESPKTRHLVGLIADLETIVVPSEAHALILEANLIKEYRPRFNIALRDDKSYPYIKVTVQEPFPRVFVTRRLEDDGAGYFGPYTDVGAMRRSLNVVKRIFTVRSCNYDMPAQMPERPCLDYYIKRCKAPCILAQSRQDYRAMIDEVVLFLSGRPDEVVRRVKERMDLASEQLDFERAAELRDVLHHLENDGRLFHLLEVMEDVAQFRGTLEVELLGREIHPLLHAAYDFVRTPRQEEHDFIDHRAVVLLRLRQNARRLAPLDVVIETRPLRHLGGHVVIAASHGEDSLHLSLIHIS